MRTLTYYLFLLSCFFLISCGETTQQEERTREAETSTQEVAEEPETDAKKILFFGNSLTAGMGLDPEKAFPAVIQQKLDSLGLNYEVINAGLSGETTAAGKNRVNWVLKQDVDVFVLELGANDGLRGVPVDETRRNLQAIIDTVQSKNPDTRIILAGMQIPPNLGPEYATEFQKIFPDLARENDIELIPFLLQNVAGDPDLNQQDGIHPTAEGQIILAQNVWETLEPVLRKE